MQQELLPYLLFAPLLGTLLAVILRRLVNPRIIEWIACLAVGCSFVGAALVAFTDHEFGYFVLLNDWLPYGDLTGQTLSLSLYVDKVSKAMLLLVTGVGLLIHIYSIGYMHADANRPRFFAYLNLFVFFMLFLVLANNLLGMFIGWEGVGLCSYLLIGFWYDNNTNAMAGKKAFIVNRVGDAGFILGLLILLLHMGTLDIHPLAGALPALANQAMPTGYWLTAATILLFVGAVGKSAQFPLLVWLPDAMAGPTPVSALIHAATMVTAGVYLIIRLNFLFVAAPVTMEVIAAVGLLTAVIAALAALAQSDIKRVLAYSTVSQLGYMFLALGVGAFSAALLHLLTHGFFKALLFMSAGSVIHAMHGEQNIERMGGLKNYLIPTTLCFGAGVLALAGLPLMSGWVSKGAILGACYADERYVYWSLGLLTALLTAVYSVRLFVGIFLGTPRFAKEKLSKVHESPHVMILPMAILAVLSVIGGYIGLDAWTQSADPSSTVHHGHSWLPTFIESIAILACLTLSFLWFYSRRPTTAKVGLLPGLVRATEQAFYLDRICSDWLGVNVTLKLAAGCRWLEVAVVERLLRVTSRLTLLLGTLASVWQRPNVKGAMVNMIVGLLFVVWMILWNR